MKSRRHLAGKVITPDIAAAHLWQRRSFCYTFMDQFPFALDHIIYTVSSLALPLILHTPPFTFFSLLSTTLLVNIRQ